MNRKGTIIIMSIKINVNAVASATVAFSTLAQGAKFTSPGGRNLTKIAGNAAQKYRAVDCANGKVYKFQANEQCTPAGAAAAPAKVAFRTVKAGQAFIAPSGRVLVRTAKKYKNLANRAVGVDGSIVKMADTDLVTLVKGTLTVG